MIIWNFLDFFWYKLPLVYVIIINEYKLIDLNLSKNLICICVSLKI